MYETPYNRPEPAETEYAPCGTVMGVALAWFAAGLLVALAIVVFALVVL